MPRSIRTTAYRSILDALIELRREKAVSQVELSERLGRPQAFVSNVERGGRRLDLVEFHAVVTALGGDPVKLYGDLAKRWPKKVTI